MSLKCMTDYLPTSTFLVSCLPCDWERSDRKLPSTVTIMQTSLEGCKHSCGNETTFICVAINYNDNTRTCELLAAIFPTPDDTSPSDWSHYTRPQCAGWY